MYDAVDASAQTRRLPAQMQDYFIIYLHSFFLSPTSVRFMSCHVTETMLYCIQTIYYKGSGETVHMCKLV